MGKFVGIEPSYISKDGCRLVWEGIDEDDSDVVVLNKEELDSLTEILSKNSAGKVELEDEFSTILVNTDIIQFRLKDSKYLETKTGVLTKAVLWPVRWYMPAFLVLLWPLSKPLAHN